MTYSKMLTVFSLLSGWNFKKLLSYLKSAPSNLSLCKISQKKCLNLEPKVPDLGIFGMEL